MNSRYKLESSLSFRAHLGNPYLGLGMAAVIVAQSLFAYAPPFQALFDTEAVPIYVWPWLLLGGIVLPDRRGGKAYHSPGATIARYRTLEA